MLQRGQSSCGLSLCKYDRRNGDLFVELGQHTVDVYSSIGLVTALYGENNVSVLAPLDRGEGIDLDALLPCYQCVSCL